jgi:uncharacterized protein YhfF
MESIEFAFPGPSREALVTAVLDGTKTSTTGPLRDYEHEGEPLPRVGARALVVDSAGQGVAVIETTAARVLPLSEVDIQHAVDEGEGYATVEQWRRGHEEFWHSDDMRAALGDPAFTVTDETLVVAQRFRVVERLN